MIDMIMTYVCAAIVIVPTLGGGLWLLYQWRRFVNETK